MYIGLGTLVVILVVVAIVYFVRRAQKMSGDAKSPGEQTTRLKEVRS
jgi:heme/copper-type cytochrome/quinol oxidase subunit 2